MIGSGSSKLIAFLVVALLVCFGSVSVAGEGEHPSFGPDDAPVTVTVYYDFQCGYCGKTAPMLLDVAKQYGDLVKLVAVNVPSPGHAYALPSAELALTAREHGKFWDAFSLLFKNQSALANEDLMKYGEQLGLDKAELQENLSLYKHKDHLKKNFYAALDMGLKSTPTTFIGEAQLVGSKPADTYRWHINQELEKKGIKSPVGPVKKPEEKESTSIGKQVPKDMIYPVKVLKPNDSKMHLKVGDKAPGFELTTLDGPKVNLKDFIGKKNLVISFVPAAWTPVCSAQWPEYNDNKKVFDANEATLIGVTVDNIPSLYSWTGTMGSLWFPVASDFYPHGKMADDYGILRTAGVSERAVFLIDKKGVIRFIDVHDINSKPDFSALKKELEKLN